LPDYEWEMSPYARCSEKGDRKGRSGWLEKQLSVDGGGGHRISEGDVRGSCTTGEIPYVLLLHIGAFRCAAIAAAGLLKVV